MKPTVLIICRHLPWPTSGGGRLRDWQNVKAFMSVGDVAVVSANPHSGAPESPDGSLLVWNSLDNLFLEYPSDVPQFGKPLSPAWWKNELGYHSDHLWNPFRHEALRKQAQILRPDIVVLEEVVLWRYLEALPTGYRLIVDCHNIQSVLDAELAVLSGSPKSALRKRAEFAAASMKQIEERLRAEMFFVCSETEADLLSSTGVPRHRIATVYNTVDAPELRYDFKRRREVERGVQIIFPGVLNYQPNIRAATMLMNQILPLVQAKAAGSMLKLVGRNPTRELMLAARERPDVVVTGEVKSTDPYLRAADVLCVPLKHGGGTRFKILEAFAAGLPVVSSRKGCEGLQVEHEHHLLVAESPKEHAAAILRLAEDERLRIRMVEQAYNLVTAKYSHAVSTRQIGDAVANWQFLGFEAAK